MNLTRNQCFDYIKANVVLKEQIFAAEGKPYNRCKTGLLNQYIQECEENKKVVEEKKSLWQIIKNFFKR